MSLFTGMTEQQRKQVKRELQDIAKARHDFYAALLKNDPNSKRLISSTIAWEFVCQNLKVPGFEWS